jgi:hypothetical protein
VVGDLVTSDIPVGHKSIICVIKGGVVGHLRWTTIRIHTLSKELVDGSNGV